MELLISFFSLGKFCCTLKSLNIKVEAISIDDIEEAISRDEGIIERLYLYYITSFSHSYKVVVDENKNPYKFIVSARVGMVKFIYSCLVFFFLLFSSLFIWSDLKPSEVDDFKMIALYGTPLLFGLPYFFGYLYFQHCKSKLLNVNIP